MELTYSQLIHFITVKSVGVNLYPHFRQFYGNINSSNDAYILLKQKLRKGGLIFELFNVKKSDNTSFISIIYSGGYYSA